MKSMDPNKAPVNLDDPSRFERVQLGQEISHPDNVQTAPKQENLVSSYVSQPAPQQPVAPQLQQKPKLTKRSPLFNKLLHSYGLKQIPNVTIDIGNDNTLTLRTIGKEDLVWAMEMMENYNFAGMVSREIIYTASVAAISVAAINSEPIYISLGLLTDVEVAAYQIRDPFYPPTELRFRCASEIFNMLIGGSEEESFPPELIDLITDAYAQKVRPLSVEVTDPLVKMAQSFRSLKQNTALTSEEKSQQKSEQQSVTQE